MTSVGLHDKVMSRVDLHPKIFSHVMISQLLEHFFFDKHLEAQRDNIDKRLNIFNFARIDQHDPNWIQMMTSSAQIEEDELFKTDKKKHVAKSRHLYIYRYTVTITDLIICLANFMFVCNFLVVDEHTASSTSASKKFSTSLLVGMVAHGSPTKFHQNVGSSNWS